MNESTVSRQYDISNQGSEVHFRYEALFHNTLDGVLIYNYIIDEVIDCNKAAGTILGYTNERILIGKKRTDLAPRFDPMFPGVDIHEASYQNGLRAINGESFSSIGIVLGHDGQRHLMKANIVPTFYQPGEAFIIFKDVTDEVLSKKALKASEGRYKDIYENSHEGIIYIDSKSLDIIMCNNRALEMFGASDIQDIRKVDSSTFFLDDCSTQYCSKRLYIEIVSKALKDGRSTFSLWHKNFNDDLCRIEGVVVSDNSQSKFPKLIAFIRDVTELYQSQNAIAQKNKQLNTYIDSNLQLENFAYLASHDLQTPLRSIISFSQLLERKIDPKLNPSEKELFRFIRESGESMGDMIDQLLQFSKIEKDPLDRATMDIEILVNQLKIEMASEIQENGAVIKFESDCKEIVADRNKLREVLRNLLSNSLKFKKEYAIPLILISCEEKPLHWLFCVKDNGIGIEHEYQDAIFTMFKKLHVKSEFGGSGFGLSMVKKIIELHNGSLWVESLPSYGTSMYFTLAKSVFVPQVK